MSTKVDALTFAQVKWLLLGSYFIAFTFDTMINLSFSIHLAPSITILLLLFWVSQLLNQTHFLTAFTIGILMDAAMNTPLGAHALINILLVFFMLRARLSFKSYPRWQQAVTIGFYLTIAQILNWAILHPSLSDSDFTDFWLSPWLAALIWPVLYNSMLTLTHRHAFR